MLISYECRVTSTLTFRPPPPPPAVGAAGGFAPSIEAPPATSEPPPTTTVDAALLPAFLGRHNTTVTVHAGDTATLSCHVVRLGDKTVRDQHIL